MLQLPCKQRLMQLCDKKHLKDDIELLNIPERMYDYAEYLQDEVLTDETN